MSGRTLLGVWADQPAPPSTARHELHHVIELSEAQLDVKVAALAEHRSQTESLAELMGAGAYRRWWATEAFRTASRCAAELTVSASGCGSPGSYSQPW